ncbi:FGGY-family carbohydrate kinase [uncultured Jatrophihabitans sp.]|uniref:FGGY-family carbohydrate kinase n=1 Tax=uncultured Jatrophihabitans sp. TaxID=1610747 RepID=UPI0035CA2F21
MFCGIDVGTQGVRAVVVDDAGTVLGEAAAALTPGTRSGREHTQSPASWWDALVVAVRGALSAAGPGARVDALAVDATSGTVLVEHPDGAAAGPALMYDDARAADEADEVARVGAELWDSLGYRMQPSWALPKAVWLQRSGDLAGRDRIVHQSDHLVGRLAGRPVATDTSNALKTGADLRAVAWPQGVFDELGLRAGLLPDLVLPGTVLATVGAAAAAETGLREGTVIRAGMTDGCAAQIAAGALRTGRWSSALGTTLVVKGATDQLLQDPAGAVYCHRHPDGGWLPGGASSTGASALNAAFPGVDGAGLGRLTEQAAQRALPTDIAYPLAGRGERFPFVAPAAEGFGIASLDDDVDRFAAVCLGIARVERLAYDVLRVRGAETSGPVALTGGTTRNAWWNQLRTDTLGRPTERPASSQAAFGMAVLAGAEPGELTATAERMVHVVERSEPDAERAATLEPGYRALVESLADRGWLDHDLAASVLATTSPQDEVAR